MLCEEGKSHECSNCIVSHDSYVVTYRVVCIQIPLPFWLCTQSSAIRYDKYSNLISNGTSLQFHRRRWNHFSLYIHRLHRAEIGSINLWTFVDCVQQNELPLFIISQCVLPRECPSKKSNEKNHRIEMQYSSKYSVHYTHRVDTETESVHSCLYR